MHLVRDCPIGVAGAKVEHRQFGGFAAGIILAPLHPTHKHSQLADTAIMFSIEQFNSIQLKVANIRGASN